MLRSKFKFFAVTFGSSFFSVTIGYLRFAVDGKIPLVKKYMSKQFLSCILIILVMLGTFFYLMNLITTNIVTNIVAKTFYGEQVDRFYAYFSHHFKGGFNFWTLFFPSFVLFSFYIFQIIIIFSKSINKMGLANTMKLLANYPTLFFFSILTNLIFEFDDRTQEAICSDEVANIDQPVQDSHRTPNQEQSQETKQRSYPCSDKNLSQEVSQSNSRVIPFKESDSMADFIWKDFRENAKVGDNDENENDTEDVDSMVNSPIPIPHLNEQVTYSFDDQIVSRIKFSVQYSRKSFRVWMILTLTIRAIDISLQAVRGHFHVPHEILKISYHVIYILAFLYFTNTHIKTDDASPTQEQDKVDSLVSPTIEEEERKESVISTEITTFSKRTNPMVQAGSSLYTIPVPSSSSVKNLRIGQETLISTMKLDTLIGDIAEGAAGIP